MVLTIQFLLLLFMVCNNCIYGKALTITVDTNGNDNPECLKDDSTQPCESLNFVLSDIGQLECDKQPIIISINNGTYNYSLDATILAHQFWHCKSISIVGNGTVINCNESEAGFAFFNSTEVTVKDISIRSCGSSQNGTSYNSTTKTASMVRTALYFTFCQDVSITGSVVEQSNNTGVVMYNTNHMLNVINSKFIYNRNTISDGTGGGGFYAEFTYCHPGFTENCIQYSNSDANYTFEGSEFSNNEASDGSEKNNTFIPANGTTNIAFGRGGGLSLIFKGNVDHCNVTISNCNISSNNATWGAGLFIEFQDQSNHNKVLVRNTLLKNNTCQLAFEKNYGTGGGGARIGFISFIPFGKVEYNTISFDNCIFEDNNAYWGGGVSYYTFREADTINATNSLSFTRCSWTANRAVLGSAIDLSVWHSIKRGVLSTISFADCDFTENVNEPPFNATYYTESHLGTGAFYSDSIPIAFHNYVNFTGNIGSAMALSATSATFTPGCNSYFLHNQGWTGGAIALLGNAWLEIYNHTNFDFYYNSAILNGGAISVVISSRHDLLSSRNCFLQYYEQFTYPQNWSTQFNFFNNTAPKGRGPSIFATSLLSCVWGNSQGQLVNGTSIKPFESWTIFNTSGEILDEVSTEIANISINNADNFVNDTYFKLKVPPGKPSKLPLSFRDDAYNPVNNSIYLLPDKHANQNVSVVSSLTADYNVTLLGPENDKSILQIVTDGPRIVSIKGKVTLAPCPPGYFWLHGKCVCAYLYNQSWNGILSCNDDEFRAYIGKDYWAGNESMTYSCKNTSCTKHYLYTGNCPKNYCSTSSIRLLPFSAQDLNKEICEGQNRNGRLCGECIDGHCVAINSRYYKCTSNVHKYNWLIWIATEYLPSTVLLVTILFYDINLHSGSLGAIVMYFQVYSSLNIYSSGEINAPNDDLNNVVNFLYNVWNLEYVGTWLHPYCLAKGLNTMQTLMISYISGFYPFLLIFIYISFGIFKRFSCCSHCVNFCIRLRWRTSLSASIINGLSTFWTLAYTKLALVSCLILAIGYLEGQKGSSYPVKHVVFLQGNLDYFHKDHLPYAIPALVILVYFVIFPSLALLCYPLITRIMAKIKKYVDLDSYRLYAYVSDKMEWPFIRFKPLLDSFQGPYKQGCEFFAGLMYWYRLGIFFTYSFASGSKTFYINLVISMTFVTLISLFQPFKEAKNNIVMLLVTVNITVINLISLYNYYEDISDFMSWFQLLLTIFPLIYFIGCAAFGIKKKIQDYIKCAPPAGLYTFTSSANSQEFNDSLLQNMAEE